MTARPTIHLNQSMRPARPPGEHPAFAIVPLEALCALDTPPDPRPKQDQGAVSPGTLPFASAYSDGPSRRRADTTAVRNAIARFQSP